MAKIVETQEHKEQRQKDIKKLKRIMKGEKRGYKICKKQQWDYNGYSAWCTVQHYPEYKAQNEFRMQKLKEGKTLEEIEREYFDIDASSEVNSQDIQKNNTTNEKQENKQTSDMNNKNNSENQSDLDNKNKPNNINKIEEERTL